MHLFVPLNFNTLRSMFTRGTDIHSLSCYCVGTTLFRVSAALELWKFVKYFYLLFLPNRVLLIGGNPIEIW